LSIIGFACFFIGYKNGEGKVVVVVLQHVKSWVDGVGKASEILVFGKDSLQAGGWW
jgi:hypothetical protein